MSIATEQTYEQRIEEIRSYLVNARKKATLAAHSVRRKADASDKHEYELYTTALRLDETAQDIDAIIYGGLL